MEHQLWIYFYIWCPPQSQVINQKISDYHQEIPHSQTADQPTAPGDRAT